MSSTFGCPHCGNANPLDVTFCASCGTYLKGLMAASLTGPSEPPPASDPVTDQSWLRPDFDRPDERKPNLRHPSLQDQPWLRAEEEETDAQSTPAASPQRLLGGLQGLIEPIDVEESLLSGNAVGDKNADSRARHADLPYETRRALRLSFATDLPILDDPAVNAPRMSARMPAAGDQGLGLMRRPWIYWLLLAVLILALWSNRTPTNSRPHAWPGVVAAHNAIDALPSEGVVLINWAYDPTSAGEMDQASLPVIQHLIEKNARLLVVSQIPTGPATARRLIAVARAGTSQTSASRQVGETLIEGGYLPGGVGSLPLLGQAPAQSIPVDIQGRSARNRQAVTTLAQDGPSLVLVVAFRSEEIQRWLEQIQPLNHAPIVAVTSAAADAAIRPYVESGQIAGLVSGYAGGIAYRELLALPLSDREQESQNRQINGQNWALAVLLLVIAVGNLAGLAERRER